MLTALLMIVGFGIAIYNLYNVSSQFTILNKPFVSVTGLANVKLPPNNQVVFVMELTNSGRLRTNAVHIKIRSKDSNANVFDQDGKLSGMEPDGRYTLTFRNDLMIGNNANLRVSRLWTWSGDNIPDSALSYIHVIWRDTLLDYSFIEEKEGEQIFGK